MIKKRLLLLIIFLIFVVSTITLFMILNYLDPYTNGLMAVIFLGLTFLFSISCGFTILLYIIKKIHYRGEVYMYHVLTSLRQGIFISIFFIGMVFFSRLGANLYLTGPLLVLMFVFLDLFIKNIRS